MHSNNKTVMFILQWSYIEILIPHCIELLKQAGVHDYDKRPDRFAENAPPQSPSAPAPPEGEPSFSLPPSGWQANGVRREPTGD